MPVSKLAGGRGKRVCLRWNSRLKGKKGEDECIFAFRFETTPARLFHSPESAVPRLIECG